MDNLTVVVGWRLCVEKGGVEAWLNVATGKQKCCAVECGAESRYYCVVDGVVTTLDGERTTVATIEV